ncbi:unnamed protein product [Clonostachys rhizophaga]|uniref:Uncharacterized protein n=1 Tax=Clonostachys rhizophaga TaxID=160324 RepID=A0A9N9YED5_9HYPO|nr:unnamed protein product [Clonostachys rhizophaga]
MSLQVSCGAGTPDSTSERTRQTAMTIFDWTYDPVSRPYHGAPNNKVPYRRPEGFPVRLVAIGALGGYMGGFFLPVGDMMLKTIDLELVPWTELHPSEGLSEREWIAKYVTPNFEAQIASGCEFELGKTWSQHGGLLALPKQQGGRSAYDLFRPDSANAFEVKDGRVVVYVHFQITEGEGLYGCTTLPGTHGSIRAREAERWEEEEESMYDSDGPGSNYQRKRPLARPAQQPPVQRRHVVKPRNGRSSDIGGSSGSSGDESGSSSGSDSNSDSGSDSGSDDGHDSDSRSGSLSGSDGSEDGSEDGSDLSSDSESESESRRSLSPRAIGRAPVKATKRAPVRAPPRAPAHPNKQPAPRNRPAPATEATRQPSSSQAVNSRKRHRAEEGSGAVALAGGPGDSTVCIKIEDDAEEGNWAAGPAARTRGAASRRPAEKRARFSNGC